MYRYILHLIDISYMDPMGSIYSFNHSVHHSYQFHTSLRLFPSPGGECAHIPTFLPGDPNHRQGSFQCEDLRCGDGYLTICLAYCFRAVGGVPGRFERNFNARIFVGKECVSPTPWKINGWNLQPSPMKRKENDLNQTSRELCSMLIFRGVSVC